MFCDWLNIWQQHDPALVPDINGGRVISIEGAADLRRSHFTDMGTGEDSELWSIAGGDLEYDVAKFQQHKGSYETTLMIRCAGGRLEIRGNPSAYGKLDNLFGLGLDEGIDLYNRVLATMGLPPFTEGERQRLPGHWKVGKNEGEGFVESYTGAHLTRNDWTQNFAVGMGKVRDVNKWIAGHKLYRSSPTTEDLTKYASWDHSTVYMSESKFYMQAKSYDKSLALSDVTLPNYLKKLKKLAAKGSITSAQHYEKRMEAEHYLDQLALYCAEIGVLRMEWSFKSRWFAQHRKGNFWMPGETELYMRETAEAEMRKVTDRSKVVFEDCKSTLSMKELGVYTSWKAGNNPKELDGVSLASFYRYRAKILEKTGHDIASKPVVSNVTELRPVFFRVRPLEKRDAPIWYRSADLSRLAA